MIDKLKDLKEMNKGYTGFVRQMHVIDICHQLELLGYKGRIAELNHYKMQLEAILIHTDPKGCYDIKYRETQGN